MWTIGNPDKDARRKMDPRKGSPYLPFVNSNAIFLVLMRFFLRSVRIFLLFYGNGPNHRARADGIAGCSAGSHALGNYPEPSMIGSVSKSILFSAQFVPAAGIEVICCPSDYVIWFFQ